jgi:hypothetical protein
MSRLLLLLLLLRQERKRNRLQPSFHCKDLRLDVSSHSLRWFFLCSRRKDLELLHVESSVVELHVEKRDNRRVVVEREKKRESRKKGSREELKEREVEVRDDREGKRGEGRKGSRDGKSR